MTDKLQGVHPDLVAKVKQVQNAMNMLGFTLIVTAGLRTLEEQAALYSQGRSLPGHIVTYDDGILHKSNHQAHEDGFGHAVDCVFLDANGQPSWAETWPWTLYGDMGKILGLTWGGDWQSIVDRPHLELP